MTKYKERLLFTAFTTDSCLLFTQEYTNREDKGRDLESQRKCQWWMRMYWVCKFYRYLLKPKTYTVIAHFMLRFLYIQCTFLIMKSDSCIAFIEESSFMYMTMSADLVWVCIYSKSTRVKRAITSVCCHQYQWWYKSELKLFLIQRLIIHLCTALSQVWLKWQQSYWEKTTLKH